MCSENKDSLLLDSILAQLLLNFILFGKRKVEV